jgi:N,N'-diacetylbacillosaminyl-diphospho-undecaprenol alpha-1,3-N-acetylgalactosaminyltransferase
MTTHRKVALVVTDNLSSWKFRGKLLRHMTNSGIDTYIITPSGPYDECLKGLGAKHIPIKVDRLLNPIMDLRFVRSLYGIFRKERFDIIHNFSVKPNIFGALAAKLAGIRSVVGTVTGIGSVFMNEMGFLFRLIRPLVTALYRIAFRLTDRVWFQNPDDANFFTRSGLVCRKKVVLIRGSGVDLCEFNNDAVEPEKAKRLRSELGIAQSTIPVSMVARTLWSKGVEEFIKTSEIISSRFSNVKFLLVGGGEEGHPLSVPEGFLIAKQSAHFTWLGWRDDVRDILAISQVVMLLTRHREGVPKSLLEAMAMSKPIIATNVPGCREVVEDGANGYLVPPWNSDAAAEALTKLLLNPGQMNTFGAHSRKKVQRDFDQALINQQVITRLYQI